MSCVNSPQRGTSGEEGADNWMGEMARSADCSQPSAKGLSSPSGLMDERPWEGWGLCVSSANWTSAHCGCSGYSGGQVPKYQLQSPTGSPQYGTTICSQSLARPLFTPGAGLPSLATARLPKPSVDFRCLLRHRSIPHGFASDRLQQGECGSGSVFR